MDYSYISEDFDINSISISILSIQISSGGFSIVISPVDSLKSPDYIYINRPEESSPERLVASLLSFNGFDLKEFYAIRIIVHEPFFALVPENIFDLQDMKAYLNLNHPPRLKSKALSNRISAAGAVCVFSIDQTLYLLLKNKFPGADFCHSSLPFITMALNKKTDGCFVQCYEESIELAVIRNQKLVHYNIFEIQDGNDIVYFILNAYKSIKLNKLIHPLFVSGLISPDSDALKLARKYIKDFQLYSSEAVIIPEKESSQYPTHYFLNHREILNCEL